MKALSVILSIALSTMAGAMNDSGPELQKRIQKITFPVIDLKDASFSEALEYLTKRSKELDGDPEIEKRGVTFMVISKPADAGDDSTITEKIRYSGRDVTLKVVLRSIAASANYDAYVTSSGLVLCPAGTQPFPNAKEYKGEIIEKL